MPSRVLAWHVLHTSILSLANTTRVLLRWLLGPEEVPVTFEGVPECLMDRLVNFLADERRKLREDNIERLQGFEGSSQAEQGLPGPGSPGLLADFQRKITPHEHAILMADVLEEVEEVGTGEKSINSNCWCAIPACLTCVLLASECPCWLMTALQEC